MPSEKMKSWGINATIDVNDCKCSVKQIAGWLNVKALEWVSENTSWCAIVAVLELKIMYWLFTSQQQLQISACALRLKKIQMAQPHLLLLLMKASFQQL